MLSEDVSDGRGRETTHRLQRAEAKSKNHERTASHKTTQDTKIRPETITKTMQKSSTFAHFWYPFELPGPPWGASGGQGETDWIPETTLGGFWRDFGTPLGTTWAHFSTRSWQKGCSGMPLGRFWVRSQKKHRNLTNF